MVHITLVDVFVGIASVLFISAIIFSLFQKTKTYSRLSNIQLPSTVRNNSSLINSIVVLLEIPPVVIFYFGPLILFGFVAIKNLYLLFIHQIPFVIDAIGSVIFLFIMVLLFLYLPYWLFGSTEYKREKFREGLQWHSDITNLDDKIKTIKDLLKLDVTLIVGFSLAIVLVYYNVI